MASLSHLNISTADTFALISFLSVIGFWFLWLLVIHTPLAERLALYQIEEWLWRKHGVTVSTLVVMLILILGVFYGVWMMLGWL